MNRFFIYIISLLFLCSCATVTMETKLPKQQLDAAIPQNMTRVIFFNESNKLLYADGSWRIGIKIDGKGVANLHFDQYVQIDLTPGRHSLELSHVDVVTFKDEYNFFVTKTTMYVRVFNGITSTNFAILPDKPNNFEFEFKPIL